MTTRYDQAFKDGQQAFLDGKPITSNPHPRAMRGWCSYLAWDAGWEDARFRSKYGDTYASWNET